MTNTKTKSKEVKKSIELTELDYDEIARRIKEGYIHGKIADGGRRIAYRLTIRAWEE